MIICPKCQTKNKDGRKFCTNCKAKLIEENDPSASQVINEQKSFENCHLADYELSLVNNEIEAQTDIKAIYDKALKNLREVGVGISESDLALLFAALSSGRLVLFTDKNAESASANVLNRLFSASAAPYCELENAESLADMLLKFKRDGQLGLYFEDTLLFKEIYKASCLESPYIVSLGIYNPPCADFKGFLTRYRETPEALLKLPIQISNNIKMLPKKLSENPARFVSPKNLWFLMSKTDEGEQLSENCVLVGMSAYFTSDSAELVKPLGICYDDFAKAVRLCRLQYYLSEEIWKKLDMLEAQLSKMLYKFSFDNRSLRTMEVLSSVYLCLRENEEQALDIMLASCVMPQLLSRLDELSLDRAGLYSFVKGFFEGMELVKCREYAELLQA